MGQEKNVILVHEESQVNFYVLVTQTFTTSNYWKLKTKDTETELNYSIKIYCQQIFK